MILTFPGVYLTPRKTMTRREQREYERGVRYVEEALYDWIVSPDHPNFRDRIQPPAEEELIHVG
jgi:hypothetical protein